MDGLAQILIKMEEAIDYSLLRAKHIDNKGEALADELDDLMVKYGVKSDFEPTNKTN
jgi:hypothetical protein